MILVQQLTSLESAGLIRLAQSQPVAEYLFRHALIYDAVHGSLVKNDRAQLHALVGGILEQQYPDRLSSRDLAPLLAYHFDQGQDEQRALKYYILAGDAAFAAFANMEAISLYSRALELVAPDSAKADLLQHLYSHRGRAFELNGQYPRAQANYLELQQLAQARSDRALELSAIISLATIYLAPTELHDQTRGAELLAQSLSLARELNDRRSEVKILWNTLMLNRFSDMPQSETIAIGQQALSLARELDMKEELAYILNDLNFIYFMAGDLKAGLAALHEAQALWREQRNLPMLADSLSGEVEDSYYLGKFDRALQIYAEARDLSESIGNLWNQSYSRYAIGLVYFERGEISQAIQIMTDCIRLAKEAGFMVAQGQTPCDLALVYAYLGQYPIALELLQAALEVAAQTFPAARLHPIGGIAHVYILQGQIDQAGAMLAQADLNLRNDRQFYGAYYWLAVSETALAGKKYAEAFESADRLITELSDLSIRPLQYDAWYMKGRALIGLSQFDEAHAALVEAQRLAEEVGSRRVLWQILIALSELEMKRGQELAAYKLRQQARQIVEAIAAHIDQIDLRESFINLPHVRAVLQE